MVPIEIRDVSLVYDTPGGKVPGVKDVSFNIGASEFICIVGPSGCGKSTLLNIIAGFLSPAAGEIRIGGKPVTGSGMDRGIVFQDFAPIPVAHGARQCHFWPGNERRRKRRTRPDCA